MEQRALINEQGEDASAPLQKQEPVNMYQRGGGGGVGGGRGGAGAVAVLTPGCKAVMEHKNTRRETR